MDYQFGLADESVLEQIYSLIDRRIRWMDEVGIQQWNVTDYWGVYPKEHYIEQMRYARLFVLKRGSVVVGTAVLYEDDPRWPDGNTASAYYVHHFAASPDEKGAGAILLRHLEEYAHRKDKALLRLDCADDNPRLNRYYQEKGYSPCGTCVDGVYRGILREKYLNEKENTPCFVK